MKRYFAPLSSLKPKCSYYIIHTAHKMTVLFTVFFGETEDIVTFTEKNQL